MSWIPSFLKSKAKLYGENKPFDLSTLAVDMHSHLLPGIDDGAQDITESIALIQKMESMGYSKIITTPHVMSDFYKNTPEIIHAKLKEVQDVLIQHNCTIEIQAAAEYFYDEFLLEQISSGKELLYFGTEKKYVLFELSFAQEPNGYKQLIFELIQQGYTPVIAHFERYVYFERDFLEHAQNLRSRGVKIQLNLLSLTGHYGRKIQQLARLLVDHQLVDFVATDCHRMEHLTRIEDSLNSSYMRKLADLNLLNARISSSLQAQ